MDGRFARDDNVWFNQLGKAFLADDAFAFQLTFAQQHPNPALQAVQVGVQTAAWVACLSDYLVHAENFAVLLRIRHGCVLVLDGVDAAEVHIHSQRVANLFFQQLLPSLSGQTFTQVTQCYIHLVLVAVLLSEAVCRWEVSDAANQVCSVLADKGAHDVMAAQTGAVASHITRGDVFLGIFVHHFEVRHQLFDRSIPGHLAFVAQLTGNHGRKCFRAGCDLEQGLAVHRFAFFRIRLTKALLEQHLAVFNGNQDTASHSILFSDLFNGFI